MSEHGRLRRAYHRFLWKKRVEIIETKPPSPPFRTAERVGSDLALACPEQKSSGLDVQEFRCFLSGEPACAFRVERELVDGLAGRSRIRFERLGMCRHAGSVWANALLLMFRFSSFAFLLAKLLKNCEGSVKGDRRESR